MNMIVPGVPFTVPITAPDGGSTAGTRTDGVQVSSGKGAYDVAASFTKSRNGTAGEGGIAALDIEGPYSGGRLLRFWNRNWTATYGSNFPDIPTYIGDRGQIVTQAWITVSGTYTGTLDATEMTPPTNDTYMIGVWSDIGDAGVAIRASTATGSYNLQGFDKNGKYTFRINADGKLGWGTSTTKGQEDTFLSRNAAGQLLIGGTLGLILQNNAALQQYKADGVTPVNVLQVDNGNVLNIGTGTLGGHIQAFIATGKQFRVLNNNGGVALVRFDEATSKTIFGGVAQLNSYTVAGLPSASTSGAGGSAYASNGRKAGEGAGAGTGIPVWSDGTSWRTYYDNTVAAA